MKANKIKTLFDMENYCKGVVNDLASGVSDSHEAMIALQDYTNRIVQLGFKYKSRIIQKHRMQLAIQNQDAPTEYFEKINKTHILK